MHGPDTGYNYARDREKDDRAVEFLTAVSQAVGLSPISQSTRFELPYDRDSYRPIMYGTITLTEETEHQISSSTAW